MEESGVVQLIHVTWEPGLGHMQADGTRNRRVCRQLVTEIRSNVDKKGHETGGT